MEIERNGIKCKLSTKECATLQDGIKILQNFCQSLHDEERHCDDCPLAFVCGYYPGTSVDYSEILRCMVKTDIPLEIEIN